MNRKWKFIIQFYNKARKLHNRPTSFRIQNCQIRMWKKQKEMYTCKENEDVNLKQRQKRRGKEIEKCRHTAFLYFLFQNNFYFSTKCMEIVAIG